MPRPPPRSRAQAPAAVLEAAEAIFAERGFAATRLEDVADRVGIRRASIVYYFKDKKELYHAVLASVFGGLLAKIDEALTRPDPLTVRIEAAVGAGIDFVGARPSIARLLLREVADAARAPAGRAQYAAFAISYQTGVRRDRAESARFARIDPVHVASTIAGATVFFVAAMPALLPHLDLDPVSPAHLAAHREEVLRIVRRLLGSQAPRKSQPAKRKRSAQEEPHE
jgi:TetR/AcrR family transcriptional regulator